MDDLLRRAAALGFGGQVVVERDGELILARAYGQADRRAGRPFAIDTPVGIASISKHLTALAVLRLVDRGRVRLSDPIERHLDSVPPDKLGITIEQLLTHTSGLPGGDAAGDFELDSRAELLERILALDRAAASGERWIYSNSGYSLLAAIVEEAAGIPYEQFVDEQLFAAAGMRHSGFWHRPPPDGLPAAHPYIGWRDQGSPADWPRNWRVFGAGDVLSTAADLYRLDRALRRGELVSRRLWRAARSVQAEIDETTGYGYGLFVYTDAAGRTVLEHGGDWQRGYNGLFMRYVDEEIVIVVTSNARDH
ncbi:MAG TPA: serine hydrolase domain-containing protein, partial [Candidatus Polarisedimenticolaceae bacterium]|nr:serine hydrolase domain-containing protein [Candidatus Polarisedimenticolaceae bacterium]